MNSISAKVIVTRNIHEKDPLARYSARLTTESRSQERRTLVVRDVEFLDTRGDNNFQYEEGFGCGIVARGSLGGAVATEELNSLQEIKFNGYEFCTKNHQRVESAKVVVFSEHGIFAAL